MANFHIIQDHLRSITCEKARGLQFEKYCKWFLENEPYYKQTFKAVWLWKNWPERRGRDKGIDLIAQTWSGEIWAIQAKAYGDNYYITKQDIDSFLSESSRSTINHRLLIATTNKIGPNADDVLTGQEKPVTRLLLDKLECADLDWSLALENKKVVPPEPKKPRKHQEDALTSILNGFEVSRQGQVRMACGTGKSLIGLWLAQRLQAQYTLVLVPSLSLISQLYKTWAANADTFTFKPIFVCSDQTVADEEDMSTAEFGYPVTTSAQELVKAMKEDDATPTVVFATYQSSLVIKDACILNSELNFDLVIADEAHRCTGKSSSDFAIINHTDSIRAQRKLYMTATPKIYSENVKSKTKEHGIEIASMDDANKFGPVFYQLLFSQAINQKLLSDYHVYISVINHATYREYADKGRFVQFDGVETDARTLATQIYTAKAIKSLGLSKVITFHNSVKNAKDFTRSFANALTLLPADEQPQINYCNVITGDQSQADRNKILSKFTNTEGSGVSILGNVKCLSEGVDVPSIDGIVFVDPKGSEIDIVQSVGRVIRTSDNKKVGTILIPVFVDADSDHEIDLENSCFKKVWQIVRALRSHDDMLAEELDNIRLELGKRAYKAPAKLNKITIDIPVEIERVFADSLSLKLIESIVTSCSSSWNYQFETLKQFRQRFSDRWPHQHEEFPVGNSLGSWCSDQRKNFECLSVAQKDLLMSIKFPLDMFQNAWIIKFGYLKDFKKLNPNRWPKKNEIFPDNNKLGVWYGAQQYKFKVGLLSKQQMALLIDIGFVGDKFNTRWNLQYKYLQKFRLLNHDKLPKRNEKFPEQNKLGEWFQDQKDLLKKGLLRLDRLQKLKEIGLDLLFDQMPWEMQFSYLCEFRKFYSNRWPKIKEKFPENNELGIWCSMQRDSYKYNKLDQQKIEKLQSIQFPWSMFDYAWNQQYLYLIEFLRINSNRWPTKKDEFPVGNKIANWCVGQRKIAKQGKLNEERVSKLNEIGFPWNVT